MHVQFLPARQSTPRNVLAVKYFDIAEFHSYIFFLSVNKHFKILSSLLIFIEQIILYVLLSVLVRYVSPETQTLMWELCFGESMNTHIITPRWKYSCWKFPCRVTACYLAWNYSMFPSIRVLLGNPCDELCNMCFYHAVLQQCILYRTVLCHIISCAMDCTVL